MLCDGIKKGYLGGNMLYNDCPIKVIPQTHLRETAQVAVQKSPGKKLTTYKTKNLARDALGAFSAKFEFREVVDWDHETVHITGKDLKVKDLKIDFSAFHLSAQAPSLYSHRFN
jgi:hypothetical protein